MKSGCNLVIVQDPVPCLCTSSLYPGKFKKISPFSPSLKDSFLEGKEGDRRHLIRWWNVAADRGSVRCKFFVTKPGAIHTVVRSAGGFVE